MESHRWIENTYPSSLFHIVVWATKALDEVRREV